MKITNHLDVTGFEVRRAKAHVLGGDPTLTSDDAGRFWYDSATGKHRGWDGSVAHTLTNLIESIVGDGTVSASPTGKTVNLAIAAASGAVRGTMSAADKSKLDAATSVNNPSALVQRDSNGDFAAGTITASLAGTAGNSTLLGGQTLTQVRDFSLTTGQRTALSAISDFDTAVRLSRLDQLATPTAPVGLGGQKITGLADPDGAQDAATKHYVDSVATGLDPKASVRTATTAALSSVTYANGSGGTGATLTKDTNGSLGSIGGQGSLIVGDRILVKNQATAAHNGIYVVTDVGSAGTPWVFTRATDADSAAEVTPGLFTFVEQGTNAATGWVLTTTGAITLGTTGLTFAQFSGAGTYSAGNGLSLSGSSFAAVGTSGRIAVGVGGIDIDAAYVGQTSITTLGTIATGTWQGTTVAVNKGGTGATDAAGARANLGAATKVATNVPAVAGGGSWTYTHNLGTEDVVPVLKEISTGEFVLADLKTSGANAVVLTVGSAISADAYRLIVAG